MDPYLYAFIAFDVDAKAVGVTMTNFLERR